MRKVIVMVCLLAGAAQADDKPVNLLVSAPTTVAVSSTVANASILPEHLVDGKLSTAWNSQTGELAGAWIRVRVPKDARIKTIKLTAGFASKTKQGDLFTMNPRIKKVRVSRAGQVLVEQALDPDNRGLQEIAVDVEGGDLEIRVVEARAGSKKTWRETCVSELEVWGTIAKPVKSKPSIRIGSLDAPPTLTREQCLKAVFPTARSGRIGPDKSDELVKGVDAVPLGKDIVICRIDHAEKRSPDTTTEIAAVKRTPKPTLIAKESAQTTNEENGDGGQYEAKGGTVQLVVFPLMTSEDALLVHVNTTASAPMSEDSSTKSTLYRVSTTGLDPVLKFESFTSKGEADSGDECELQEPALKSSLPNLALKCTSMTGAWHGEDPRGNGIYTKDRTERYRWNGTAYEKK
jgi:hypothetical protein